MNKILDKLNWRYATKKFDSSKKVSNSDLNTLLEATRLSASSYGLQPYHIFVVEQKNIRERLKPVSWEQSQITDASHLIIFANKPDFGEELVDNYLNNVSAVRSVPQEDLKGYSDFMKSNLMGLSHAQKDAWTAKQVYLALGNAMTIAAELKIDTCPMEGFEVDKYDEILGLADKNLKTSVVLAIGYRSGEDDTQHYPKVRYAQEKLFTHL
ncbi:NAD(P)H-dependent oxidoreductase [Maribacter sp. 2304DJ31-5]|uniref:NAD(P)H-dependent oxidoreductase n=1 Tax=Maribacter sp. 2304DJ31-5 TaxID=3386273 RepID=UPI0039BD3042